MDFSNLTSFARPLILPAATACAVVTGLIAKHYDLTIVSLVAFGTVLTAGYFLSLQVRLEVSRRAAIKALDGLRAELRRANEGKGADYSWIRYTPWRPGWDDHLRATKEQADGLQVQVDSLQRTMEARKFWQPVSALKGDLDRIAAATRQPIEALTDSIYWSSGGSGIVAAPRQSQQLREPRLRVVVNNERK